MSHKKKAVLEAQGESWLNLVDCNRYMLENEVACDVSFKVAPPGGQTELVRAHRYMLIARNPVFKAMLCGIWADTEDTIIIQDIQPATLRDILEFLYCETIDITCDNVFDILYAAKKYLIHPVTKKCFNFLKDELRIDTVCPILNCALFYGEEELARKCLRIAALKIQQLLDSGAFYELSKEAIRWIVESESLDISERQLFEACIAWSKMECERQCEEYQPGSLRRYLEDSFYHFRILDAFNELTYSSFLTYGLLSIEEEQLLEQYFKFQNKNNNVDSKQDIATSLAKFSRVERRRILPGEYRCDLVTKSSYPVLTDTCPQVHGFTTSENIILQGIEIINSPRSGISGLVIALKQDSVTKFQTLLSIPLGKRDTVYGSSIPFYLPKKIPLQAGDFVIELNFKSPGQNARVGSCKPLPEGVEVNGIKFKTSCTSSFHIGTLLFSVE